MKSIKEKAKRYDEAIEKLKGMMPNWERLSYNGKTFLQDLVYIFPELKESEDEKIRKALIELVRGEYMGCCTEEAGKERDMFLAWLEAQGEHANFRNKIQIGDEVTRNEDGVLVNLSQMKRIAKSAEEYNITGIGSKHAQGKLGEMIENLKPVNEVLEQKPADKVEPKFKIGQTIKKEGFNLGFTIVKIEDGFYYNDMGDYFPFTDQDNWELIEQNFAWSEEDERIIDNLISQLGNLSTRKLIKEETKDKYVNWLKSLKARYTWKPSNEQMKALDDFIYAKYPNIEKYGAAVKSLYQDLKKLREE